MDSVAELSYAAGVLDSDGTVFFTRAAGMQTPHVVVAGQSDLLMQWLKQRWAGYIETGPTCYRFVARGGRAVSVVQAVRSYLLVKTEQADLVLEWDSYCHEAKGCGSKDAEQRRQWAAELAERCRELNRLLSRQYKAVRPESSGKYESR